METAETPQLKGFDAFELKLGDELRGERASKGKTLLDVQRDLRIRADYIDAIENADASAFPFAGFAAGYVRSYARYLGLDADDVYRRFCMESGFEGVEGGAFAEKKPCEKAVAAKHVAAAKTSPIQTKFLPAAQRDRRIEIGASLRGLASIGVLAALVVGLGYGGWSVLQNIQRVGFAPLPTTPTVQVSAPDFLSPDQVAAAEAPVASGEDEARITLAALYATQELASPAVEPRDGPIASIDPARAGVYAPPPPAMEPEFEASGLVDGMGEVDPSIRRAFEAEGFAGAATEEDAATTPLAAPMGVTVLAVDEAWVRVRSGENEVLFTGILGAGEHFELPASAVEPNLRAGNAGSVYIVIDGEAFGPLGKGPEVAKGVQLTPEAVRSTYPLATDIAVAPARPRDDREASLPGSVALHSE